MDAEGGSPWKIPRGDPFYTVDGFRKWLMESRVAIAKLSKKEAGDRAKVIAALAKAMEACEQFLELEEEENRLKDNQNQRNEENPTHNVSGHVDIDHYDHFVGGSPSPTQNHP